MVYLKQKRAQATIFIIVAVVIVALALFAFIYFSQISPKPTKFQEVENYFLNCIDEKVKDAARISGLQAGYIEHPDFEAGSAYMPFSSRLNFLGASVPYWMYISGNNIAKTQKPSLELIESQFENYVEQKIKECDFRSFEEKGYLINFSGEPTADIKIREDFAEAKVDWILTASIDGVNSEIKEHRTNTKTNFGKIYSTAVKIYNFEQKSLFLENYSYDILNLYAPMTGLELSCAPKVWSKQQIQEDVEKASEANIASIKVKGNYYSLSNSDNRYFVVDIGENIEENVYFYYSKDFPTRFEIWPSENNILTASPVGKQPGLGILSSIGFCYVPYHFVYDAAYPVLIRVSRGDEIFQFPVIVSIEKNEIRNASVGEINEVNFDICNYKIQNALFYTYDDSSKPLEAEISYKCFNQVCELGKTSIKEGKAMLEAKIPKCYNGAVNAKADGYKTAKLQVETTETFTSSIFLQPSYTLNVEMNIKNDEKAVVSFASKEHSSIVYYPEQKQVEIAEGTYNVTINVFKESNIILESQKVEKCIEVPDRGIMGIFGFTREECYDLDIPEQSLTNVLIGGGSAEFSATNLELKNAKTLVVDVETYNAPKNIIELTDIYTLIEISKPNIKLK